jgi:5-keto-L-gluconate epimerase
MQSGRLWHVHLGDSNRLSPGQGHFDFAALVESLKQNSYTGYLSAELLPRPDADVAATLTVDTMHSLGV